MSKKNICFVCSLFFKWTSGLSTFYLLFGSREMFIDRKKNITAFYKKPSPCLKKKFYDIAKNMKKLKKNLLPWITEPHETC